MATKRIDKKGELGVTGKVAFFYEDGKLQASHWKRITYKEYVKELRKHYKH